MTPTHAWFCQSCGAMIWRVFVPPDRKAEDYAPVECGHCSSILFTVRTTRAAA